MGTVNSRILRLEFHVPKLSPCFGSERVVQHSIGGSYCSDFFFCTLIVEKSPTKCTRLRRGIFIL